MTDDELVARARRAAGLTTEERCYLIRCLADRVGELTICLDEGGAELMAARAWIARSVAALAPVVREIRRVRPESEELVLCVGRCRVSLSDREADAVLAAAGEQP